MEMKDFFYFFSRNSAFRAIIIGFKDDSDAAFLDKIYKLNRSEFEDINFPVIFKQSAGKKLMDILDTEYAKLYLISDKLKTLLEKNKFTGWEVYPIKLFDKKENEIKGYYGFSIKGVCGPHSYKNSKIIEKRFIPGGPLSKFYKGVSIGLDEWDGSDFFSASDSRKIIVTKQVANTLKSNKITNLELTNLTEVEIDEFYVNKYILHRNK